MSKYFWYILLSCFSRFFTSP